MALEEDTPVLYGPEGRLVLVDSALEAVSRGSTTVGIKNIGICTSCKPH